MEILKNKSKLKFLIAAILVLLTAGAGLWFFYFKPASNNITSVINEAINEANIDKPVNYVIPNIPYIGIFNHKGEFANISADAPSAIISLLEYWNPGKNNFIDIANYFSSIISKDYFISTITVEKLMRKFGDYKFITLYLDDVSKVKKYINPEIKTPLFLFNAVDKDQPLTVLYYPASLLIGIKESEKKLVFHDYWLGNNYEITYDEFNKMQEKMPVSQRSIFLVVQPKNFKNYVFRKAEPYPIRTSIMEEGKDMFKDFAIGAGARRFGLYNVAMDYFLKITKNPKFDSWFPPYWKVSVWTRIAEGYFALKDFNKALDYTNMAIDMNHDLDKPFKDWPGYEITFDGSDTVDRIGAPYKILGDIYKELKDFQKAKMAYQQSLAIQPAYNTGSVENLKLVELELLKK